MNIEDYKIAYENVMTANKMLEKENKELKEKLSKIKELINRTPRQTPKEIAYVMLKGEIAEVIGDDKK